MIYARKLLGRWQGASAYYHAVDSNEFPSKSKAVCGRVPYYGWEAGQGAKVTCPRCLRKATTPQSRMDHPNFPT